MYSCVPCVPTGIQLYTLVFNVVTFYFTKTFPHCNCRSAVNDSAGGSFSHSGALAGCGVQPAGWVPGRVQRVLPDTYNRQFKFTGVTGVSEFGTYSTTAVLEY